MVEDKTDNQGSLVPTGCRELVQNSGALIQRGLQDLVLSDVEQKLDRIYLDLCDYDFDVRARAIMTLNNLKSHLGAEKEVVRQILLVLCQHLHECFGVPHYQPTLFDKGHKYYPPNEEFRQILEKGIQAIEPTIAKTFDAIRWLFYKGNEPAKVNVVEWLAYFPIYGSVEFLKDISEGSSRDRLRLAARYALFYRSEENPEEFYTELVEHIVTSKNEQLIELSWEYLHRLSDRVCVDAVGEAFCALAQNGKQGSDDRVKIFLTAVVAGHNPEEYAEYSDTIVSNIIIAAHDLLGDRCADEMGEEWAEYVNSVINERI